MKKLKKYQPTASELAMLTSVLIQRYTIEKGKEITRFRLARRSLMRLAIRSRLHDTVIAEWIDFMALERGWLVSIDEEDFVLVKSESAKSWTKIGTKRCDDLIVLLNNGENERAFDIAENEAFFYVSPTLLDE